MAIALQTTPIPFSAGAFSVSSLMNESPHHAMGTGVILTGKAGRVVFANASAVALLGFESHEAVLHSSIDDWFSQWERQDADGRALPYFEMPPYQAMKGEVSERVLFLSRPSDNLHRALYVRSAPVQGESDKVLTEIVSLTAVLNGADFHRQTRRRFEAKFERLMRLHRITSSLYSAVAPNELIPLVVTDCVESFGAQWGMLFLAEEGQPGLRLRYHVGPSENVEKIWSSFDASLILMQVFQKGGPSLLAEEPLAKGLLVGTGQSGVCLPVVKKGVPIGLLVLAGLDEMPGRRLDHAFLAALGEQIGNAIERCELFESERQARAEAQRARENATFLADASALLVRHTNAQEALSALCQLSLERRADFCEVLLLDEVEGVSSAALASSLMPVPVSLAKDVGLANGAVFRCIYKGKTEWLNQCDHEQQFRRMGCHSAVVAPMRARGRILGAICWASAKEAHFSDNDLRLLENLASRTALAIDNFRLLEHANSSLRAREHLLSILSHDVRTPLGVIQMKAQQLRRRLPVNSLLTEFVDAILKAGWKTSDLIRDLLDIAAIQRGEARLRLLPVPMGIIFSEAMKKQKELAPTRHIRAEIDASTAEALVLVDRPAMVRVFESLFDNAYSEVPSETEVKLRVHKEHDKVIVTLQDSGPGLSKEALHNIFGKYWRVGPELSHIGLGFFIARSWVDAHKGTLDVQSGEGQGKCVTFTLPLASH